MAVNLVQSAYRIRGDRQAAQGGTPAWYGAQNTVAVPTQQAPFRIRFQIENTGATDSASVSWELYASRNGGAYAAVTTGTTFVQGTDGSGGNSTNNSALTSALLSGGVTTFSNGLYCDSANTAALILPAAGFTELEFGVVFTSSLVAADTYAFRVYNNSLPLNTYTNTPTLSPTTNLPELHVTSIQYYEGTSQFAATVHNAGPGDTPIQLTVACAFFVDGVQQTYGLAVPDPTQILAGADYTLLSSAGGGPYTIPSGTHLVRVLADDSNRFTEVTTAFRDVTVPITVPALWVSAPRMTSWTYT